MGKMDGGLRLLFRQRILGVDWVSIESGITGAGIPDLNFCYKAIEGWIECKQTPGHTVTLDRMQVGWIARRVRNGGRVWIAVRQKAPAGPRRVARDVLWIIPGHGAALAKEHGLHANIDGMEDYHGGPSKWPWQAIASKLIS